METSRLIATKGVTIVALLLLGLSLMPSALAQAQTANTACQGSCGESSAMQYCSQGAMGCCGGSPTTIPGDRTYEVLTQPELHLAVAKALADSDVQALQRAFIKMGYMPRYDDAAAVKTTETNKNGIFWNITTVLPFTERTPRSRSTPTPLTLAAIIYFDYGQDDTSLDASSSIGFVRYRSQLDENTSEITFYALDENRQLTTGSVLVSPAGIIKPPFGGFCKPLCEAICRIGFGGTCVLFCVLVSSDVVWLAYCLGGFCREVYDAAKKYGCPRGCDYICQRL